MGANFSQLFPPRPAFTEDNIPSQAGKVFIVTGGNTGIGAAVVKILYSKDATVYIASRSPTKIAAAIEDIKSLYPNSAGHLKGLTVDVSDLAAIKPAVDIFLSEETRLDVLFNNAGTAQPDVGDVSPQGEELCMSTNCLGPYLLTKLLLPILQKTAATSPTASVRTIFTGSGLVDLNAPPGGIIISELASGQHPDDGKHKYAMSKTGNCFLASEFDKRFRKDGIVFVSQNPGVIISACWKLDPITRFLSYPVLHEPRMGALTVLWSGLSPDVTEEDGGRYAIPWGRWHPSPRKDLVESMKWKEEGGTGIAAEFWDWCEERTKAYSRL